MSIEYEVRALDAEIAEAYGRLLPEQRDLVAQGKLGWKFEAAPAAPGVLALARLDGRIVGINGFAPAWLRVGGRRVRAFQSLDTVVDPACRGKGVFTGLVNAFYAAAAQVDAAAVYGIPNENSAGGFFGKLGWTRLPAPPFLVKPLNAGYFARRLIGPAGGLFDAVPLSLMGRPREDARVVRVERFDDRADALWNAFAIDIPCAVERTGDMLNWRLVDCPSADYDIRAVEASDGALNAMVATHVSDKHGGRIGYVMEAMARPGAAADLNLLLRDAIHRMRRDRVDAVLAWSAPEAPNHAAYRQAGFLPMPEWSRPIHLAFGARALADPGTVDPTSLTRWYLSYLDSDTV